MRGHNRSSIGICYEGGLDAAGGFRDTRTEGQKESILILLKLLIIRFPGSRICGHRDLGARKACPCFNAEEEYAGLVRKCTIVHLPTDCGRRAGAGGIALLFMGFWCTPAGEIHNSVLVGFGEISTFPVRCSESTILINTDTGNRMKKNKGCRFTIGCLLIGR